MTDSTPHFWPEFTGKVVIVTGGGSGIGRAIVTAFARNGARIVAAGRDARKLERTVAAVNAEYGVEALAAPTDVSDPSSCAALIEAATARFRALDVLVNNAALFALTPLLDAASDAAALTMATNFHGPLFCGQAFARWAIANERPGAIVNVSSIAGAHPAPGCALYSASKAALDSLTKSMALEWGPLGVRVSGVAPGHVDTEGVRADFESGALDYERILGTIPARRIADVDDIANAVLFLASAQARHVVGATLTIDGGEAM